MSTSIKLDEDENGEEVDEKVYQRMIGSLFYLKASELDIILNVRICVRSQLCPKFHISIHENEFLKYLYN